MAETLLGCFLLASFISFWSVELEKIPVGTDGWTQIRPWDHFVHFSPHSLGDIMADVLAKFCNLVKIRDSDFILPKLHM